MFFWNSLAFKMIQWMLAVWSLVPCLSKSNLTIWKFLVHVLLKPPLENFEHYFASMQNECSCPVLWTLFGTALLWDWNENWPIPVLWPYCCVFQICWYTECSTLTASSFRIWNTNCLMGLKAESEEELTKEPLEEGEGGEWKIWLKTQDSKN